MLNEYGPSLQWGRNLSVAEGTKQVETLFGAVASMGPQPFGCGRTVSAQRASPPSPRFNGAATFRLRKERLCVRF